MNRVVFAFPVALALDMLRQCAIPGADRPLLPRIRWDIPEDARVVGLSCNPRTDTLDVVVEHRSFPEVGPGQEPPRVMVEGWSWEAPRTGGIVWKTGSEMFPDGGPEVIVPFSCCEDGKCAKCCASRFDACDRCKAPLQGARMMTVWVDGSVTHRCLACWSSPRA